MAKRYGEDKFGGGKYGPPTFVKAIRVRGRARIVRILGKGNRVPILTGRTRMIRVKGRCQGIIS